MANLPRCGHVPMAYIQRAAFILQMAQRVSVCVQCGTVRAKRPLCPRTSIRVRMFRPPNTEILTRT